MFYRSIAWTFQFNNPLHYWLVHWYRRIDDSTHWIFRNKANCPSDVVEIESPSLKLGGVKTSKPRLWKISHFFSTLKASLKKLMLETLILHYSEIVASLMVHGTFCPIREKNDFWEAVSQRMTMSRFAIVSEKMEVWCLRAHRLWYRGRGNKICI